MAEKDLEESQKLNHMKKMCLGLQSLDRKVRKQTYIEMENYLSSKENDFTNQELRNIFTETYMYTLNGLRDKTESVREQAIQFINFLIVTKLPLNDFYLTYVFPILVERVGSVEVIEESEEIRLQLLQLLDAIITRYSNTTQLRQFLNDSIIILSEIVKDKYPAVKELSCRTIVNLANALPRDFHMQAENLIKPVLTCFGHQRYKVRVESIYTIGEIVLHSTYKGLDEVIVPLAEKLFDQIPIVRRAVGQVAARWMLEYKDRYSFFYKILPLLLTGLNDEIFETRMEAAELWEKVGLQYQLENQKDLKDELDYLTAPPKYYPPNIIRPNLGCRTLVKRNVIKLSAAISRELMSWQEDVRVRCSQLLCSLALHAEEGITQNLQDLFMPMYSAARDDDTRVVGNIIQSSELIGCFVKYGTWSDLVLPMIEDGPHYGHLTVLCGLVKGSPLECISEHVENISKLLAEDSICYTRKIKNQLEMVKCVQVLSEKHTKGTENDTGYYLFKIIVSLLSLRHPDNAENITENLLDDVSSCLKVDTRKELWSLYSGRLLNHINKNPKLWTTVTEEECIFSTILVQSNEAFGENLEIIKDILKEVLDLETDGDTRLKIFYVLATAFEKKEVLFRNAPIVTEFLESLIQDIFVPSLVWHAGATAEAIRTMSASCLKYTLLPVPNVELFSRDNLRPLVDQLIPLLVSLMEDASYHSRQIAIDTIVLLKENCFRKGVWVLDDLIRIYPEVLKRLDDPTDKVRLSALENLPILFKDAPEEFKTLTYRAHHELIIDTLLTHFDDDEENVREMVYRVFEIIATINKDELLDKIEKHRPLLRNQKGCDKVIENFNALILTEVS